MITITKRLEFDAAHRVLGHEGHCKNLHGHRYAAEITCTAPQLDSLGRVVDFSCIKTEVGGWINKHLDHNFIANSDDDLVRAQNSHLLGDKIPFIMPYGKNPTAENIAEEIFGVAKLLLAPHQVKVVKVRIYETPSCWADYFPPVKWDEYNPTGG